MPKGYFLSDNLARQARGDIPDVGDGLVSSHVLLAVRDFPYFVMPGLDVLDVVGDVQTEVDRVKAYVLSRSSRRNLWGDSLGLEYSISQHWVSELARHRHVYLALTWAQKGDTWLTARVDPLPPETIARRGRGRAARYEQYVSRGVRYRPEGPRWYVFTTEEIIHLEWPLEEPRGRGTPAQIAYRRARKLDSLGDEMLYATAAAANPEEMFLPYVLARWGKYRDVVERLKNAEACIESMLFYPPRVASMTRFFSAERAIRTKAAAACVREYILRELNEQWLARWADRNGWRRVEIVFRPPVRSSSQWRALHKALLAGQVEPGEVEAELEAETALLRRSR